MSLTRQKLLELAKPRFEWVEVDGFGKVGIQSQTPVQRAHRETQYYDAAAQAYDADQVALADVHQIIDQVCEAPDKPMFGEDDVDELAGCDSSRLAPLLQAIAVFNNGDPKKTTPTE